MGAVPRSYQVTPAGPSHPVPTKRMNANPKAAPTLRARHQVIRIQPPQAAPHPDTEGTLVVGVHAGWIDTDMAATVEDSQDLAARGRRANARRGRES